MSRCFAPLVCHHFSCEAHQTPRSDLWRSATSAGCSSFFALGNRHEISGTKTWKHLAKSVGVVKKDGEGGALESDVWCASGIISMKGNLKVCQWIREVLRCLLFIGTHLNSRGKVEPFNLSCICRMRSREELAQHLCIILCKGEGQKSMIYIWMSISQGRGNWCREFVLPSVYCGFVCPIAFECTLWISTIRQCPKCTALIRVCDSLGCLKHHEIWEHIAVLHM